MSLVARQKAEIIEVKTDQVDDLLRRLAAFNVDEKDRDLIRALFESYAYVTELVEDKSISIQRLRNLLFGSRTEKTRDVVGNSHDREDDESDPGASPIDASMEASEQSSDAMQAPPSPKKGHGRNAADAYRGGDQIEVPHASLEAGDPCPECRTGTVYEVARPGVLVRLVGQAPVHATVYHLQKLRCHLCGKVFTADPPEQAGSAKYDATAAAMIAVLKYGSGLPFNRLAGLQRNLETPLPASTQWDVVHAFAASVSPAYDELLRQAAQGEVLHNDDTTIKILEAMGQRKADSSDEDPSTRTGLFTSGVVATCGGDRIALFFSGRQHAGENLADVLKQRVETLDAPIQMCDALSRNLPPGFETIVANCLAHARRQFVEIHDRFPGECDRVLEAFEAVYRHEAQAAAKGMSPTKRLRYHQQKSRPVMERLHNWLNQQFARRAVEPNSPLGGAFKYLLKHWEKLTAFLRVAGAPLDNNLCERALKKAILHRKNSLFYRSHRGAQVGDLYMSLIHTCELCGANPFEYLTELMRNPEAVEATPTDWLPWTYRDTLAAAGEAC